MNSTQNALCGRCNEQKEKVFAVEANPSFAWGGDELTKPPAVYSCKECLSEDEVAVLLAPVALFAVETLFKHRLADVGSVLAVLRHRGGSVNSARPLERAKAML